MSKKARWIDIGNGVMYNKRLNMYWKDYILYNHKAAVDRGIINGPRSALSQAIIDRNDKEF